MVVIKTVEDLRNWRCNIHDSVGFIPTMGYLHEGHVSLMNIARKENDHVVVSIFVNPKQFGPNEDLNKYPRDVEKDLILLKKAGVTAAFLPTAEEIYPEGFETIVSVPNLSKKLEGQKRPGHFDGVATIITKLFNVVQPTRAYFGQKDAQQVVVVKKLVKDLAFPVAVIVGETIRQNDGLALSSRNTFLAEEERKNATCISESLILANKLAERREHNTQKIKDAMQALIEKSSGVIDYISITDPETLDEITTIHKKALVSLAVYFGKTRLIDNRILSL